MAMTDEELLVDLTAHDGWKVLSRIVEERLANLNRVDQVTNAEDLWIRKGRIEEIRLLLRTRADNLRLLEEDFVAES
jgi:hypothetical protein